MNSIHRDFLLLTKKLLVEVRTLNFNFLRLQEKVEAISKQKQSEKAADDKPFSPVVSVLTTPAAIKVEAETHDNKDVWQRVFEILELLGIAAVAAYAVLTYYTWKEMVRSTNAAESAANTASIALANSQAAFRIDERPYLWLTKNPEFMQFFPIPNTTTGQITWSWHITNYGKTPPIISCRRSSKSE